MINTESDVLEGYRPKDRIATENNDCVVCAIANVTDAPYREVHALLKKAGRKDRKGFHTYRFFGERRIELGHTFVACGSAELTHKWHSTSAPTKVTLSRFAKQNPKGKFLVTIAHHALCVLNGVIVETNTRVRRSAKVKCAWLVSKN